MAGGRPTKYTHELLEKAWHYVENYEEYGHAFPSDIGLASACGISDATLYSWAKDDDKPEFLEILEKVNRDQQFVAWNKGLRGEYNANLVKLLLGKHGFSDKQTLEGDPEKPLAVTEIVHRVVDPKNKSD